MIDMIKREALGKNRSPNELNIAEASKAFRQNISTRRYLSRPLPLPIASSLSFIKAWTQTNTTIDPPTAPKPRTEDNITVYLRRQTRSRTGTQRQRLAMRFVLKYPNVKCDVLEIGWVRFDNHTVKSSGPTDKNTAHRENCSVSAQPQMGSGV